MADYRPVQQGEVGEDSPSSSASPFVVQSPSKRARVNVGTSTPDPLLNETNSPAFSDALSGQLEGVTSNFEINQHPLSKPAFLLGLKWAGHLEPLETSRNKIKQRFNHFLEKGQFKLNLAAFLENAGVEKLGESMIRFVGAEELVEPHSPYVGVYIKSAIQSTEGVKIYAAVDSSSNVAIPSSSTSINPSSTQWTFLLADDGVNSCEWSCKAKRFWPVRVRFEGPTNSQPLPSEPPSAPPTRPRGKRRDTFQHAIDLDDELQKREKKEEEAFEEKQRLKLNTTKNSARPSNSPAIQIDTKKTAPVEPPLAERPQRTPTTPTVLESAKQLGQSIVASLPPSMQQLPAVMQSRLKQWFDRPESPGGGDFDEDWDSEEDRRRREKRRRRRERRRREEAELLARARGDRRVTEAAEAERLARVEDRRSRRLVAAERE
ncbi:hypothetical protein JCM3765_001659 [Sporobolomyces pararoseus]